MKKTSVTLKDIAQELNLSISTVSRALKGHYDISPKTKKLVTQKAKEMNYYPNLFAQGFRNHRSRTIGVVVPKISHYFTSTMLEGILGHAEKKGYKVIVSESKNSHKTQIEMLHNMIQYNVDGVLLSLTKATEGVEDILKILERVPLVMFDKVSTKIPCTQIIVDDKKAAYHAVEHLINIGKKRIAIFKETEKLLTSERRFEGYLQALSDHNIPIDPKLVFSVEDLSLEKGRELANLALSLKERPDAIFAITDTCAIGAMQVLNKFRVAIPEEIAVVGFSNSFSSTIIQPKLTTINQPGNIIGKTAIKYLIKEIGIDRKEGLVVHKTIEIATDLIVRASTLKVSG